MLLKFVDLIFPGDTVDIINNAMTGKTGESMASPCNCL